jgi:hypothetical protein
LHAFGLYAFWLPFPLAFDAVRKAVAVRFAAVGLPSGCRPSGILFAFRCLPFCCPLPSACLLLSVGLLSFWLPDW